MANTFHVISIFSCDLNLADDVNQAGCETVKASANLVWQSPILIYYTGSQIFFFFQFSNSLVFTAAICSMYYLLKNQHDQKEEQQNPFLVPSGHLEQEGESSSFYSIGCKNCLIHILNLGVEDP